MIPSARCRGNAMAASIVMLVLTMMVWVCVYRQMAGSLRAETICRLRDDQARGSARAMAWALALLETGRPGQTIEFWCWSYSCRVVVNDQTGDCCVIEYVKMNLDATEYRIAVRPATPEDGSIPMAPETFAGG